jgi:hypothetical protein
LVNLATELALETWDRGVAPVGGNCSIVEFEWLKGTLDTGLAQLISSIK